MSDRPAARAAYPVRGQARQDIVFYAPYTGWMLSTRQPHMTDGAETWGGAERQTLSLATALAARGARVTIVAFGRASDLPAEVDGVKINARPPRRGGRGLVGKLVETMEICRSLWTAPSRTIVHRGGASVELGVLALYARFARRRLIFAAANVADFEYRRLESNRLYRFMYTVGARLAHAIVVQTEEQAELCRATFGRRPVLIKSMAPPADGQAHAPEAFLWIGRLKWYKRPHEFIALARAVPEARFWMVGVPSPYLETDRMVAESVSTESQGVRNLELVPPQPHGDLQSLVARAVACVNTSDFEGMPNVLLEGWSRGVPALVLSHDPAGVVSTHGLGHYAHGSRDHLATLARTLWITRHDRGEISRRCRSYVQTHHAPDVIAEQWLNVLTVRRGRGRPVKGGERPPQRRRSLGAHALRRSAGRYLHPPRGRRATR